MADDRHARRSIDAGLAVRERHESIESARRILARSEARVRSTAEQLARTNLLLVHLKRLLAVAPRDPRVRRHATTDR